MGYTKGAYLLKQKSKPDAHIKDLSGGTVAVDLDLWLHKGAASKSYCNAYHIEPPIPLNEIAETVLKLHALFNRYKVKPIYVIGGKKHVFKKRVDDARAAKVAASLAKLKDALLIDTDITTATSKSYIDGLVKLRKNACTVREDAITMAIKALRGIDATVFVALSEAEWQCVAKPTVGTCRCNSEQ